MLAVLFTVALVIGISSLAAALETARPQVKVESDNPIFTMINVIGVEATVEAIDYDKRTATLKRPEVEAITIQVDKAAKNFDQVEVGDQVITEYIELVTIFIHESNAQATAERLDMVQAALKKQRPDGIAVNATEVTATIQAIDYNNSTMTLKGPQGGTATLNVDPGDQNFNQMRVGHELVVQNTKAIAITVQKHR